jgi:hypothetical protein
MASCDLIATCIFFNDKMVDYPAAAAHMKKTFCQGDPDSCARLMIVKTLGRPHVPADLFPNQSERARTLIAGKG